MPPHCAGVCPATDHRVHHSVCRASQLASTPNRKVHDPVAVEIVLEVKVRERPAVAEIERILYDAAKCSATRGNVCVLPGRAIVEGLRKHVICAERREAHSL